jgi:hypothetical protein
MLKNDKVKECEKEIQKYIRENAEFYYRPNNADLLNIVSIFENNEYDLSKINKTLEAVLVSSCVGNKKRIDILSQAKKLGLKVSFFAFPFGDYGQETKNLPQAEKIIMEQAQKNYSFVLILFDNHKYF